MRKKLLRFLCAASLAIIAGQAHAQTTGTIIGVITDASTGKPVEGAVVIATSPNLQGEQTAVTGKDGSYAIRLLPGGQYKLMVQIAGFKPSDRSDIRLSADKTLRANMSVVPEAVTLEEQVVRTGIAPSVNVGSAESATVVSSEFVANIPTGRSYQAIASVVPQAANDQYGVGFAGAQSPENGYIVDGLNTTDPVYGAAPGTASFQTAPTMLASFIQEVDVKTGSFMPEYGRATGGIISVVPKSGSNEFHGSVFSSFRPDFLVQPNGKTFGRDAEAIASFRKPGDGTYYLDFGAEAGGPILKDRLWFYAGFAPIYTRTTFQRFQRTNVLAGDAGAPCTGTAGVTICRDANGGALWNKVAGSESKGKSTQDSYQWLGKLTYLINDTNSVSLSTFGQPSTQNLFGSNGLQNGETNYTKTGVDQYDVAGHYQGKFLDKRLIVEFNGGWHGQRISAENSEYQKTTPHISWDDTGRYALYAFEPINGCTDLNHCPVRTYGTGGQGFSADQKVDRYAGKVTASGLFNLLGSHVAKIGIDLQRDNYDQSKYYPGGWFFRNRNGYQFEAVRGYGVASGPAGFTSFGTVNTTSYADSFSYFLQDGWQIANTGVTLNAGVRLETQKMVNKVNTANQLNVKDSWAPRFQAIWDFTGNGRGKAAASWGRFYWAIPLDMGDRSFGSEREVNFELPYDAACLAALGLGAPLANPGNATNQLYGNFQPSRLVPNRTPACTPAAGFTQTGGDFTPVQPGLKQTAVDMFGGQVEYEVLSDLSVGIEYSGRRQVRVIEDMSPNDGGQYFIANPGDNVSWDFRGTRYSAKSAEAFDSYTGRTLNIKFPSPERSYDGLTLRLAKNYSRNWMANASYTYSVLRGNYAGPSLPDYTGGGTPGQGQLDPGITAAFDLPTLLSNTKGLLPADSTHVVKLFGSYTWNLGPRFAATAGAGYTGASGRPVTALGSHDLYGQGLSYIIPQGQAGRTAFTHQMDLRGQVSYIIRAPYEVKFSVDVLNVMNQQEIVIIDQNYTANVVHPIQGVSCNRSVIGARDPGQALRDSCPDVAFMKTNDGRRVTPNLNFGKAAASNLAYQTPIQLRFGLALTF